FRRTTLISLAVSTFAYAGLVIMLVVMAKYLSFLSGRLPELNVLIALAIIGVANLYVGSAATLMRAFKREPMLPISIVAAAIYVGAMFLSHRSNSEVLFALMTIGQVIIIVPLTIIVKRHFLARRTCS